MKFLLRPPRTGGLHFAALPLLVAGLLLPTELNAQAMLPESEPFFLGGEHTLSAAEASPGLPADNLLQESAAGSNGFPPTESPEAEEDRQEPEPGGNIRILYGDEATTQRMFGARGGYFHPFLIVRGEWTDNLYNLNFDETDNFLTTVSSGVWVSLPRTEEIPLQFETRNSAIGGLRFSLPPTDSFDRYQAYLGGAVDYSNYSADSDLNHTAWRLEGLYQHNLPADISFRFIDQFSRGQDKLDLGSFAREDFSVEEGDIVVTSTPSAVRSYYSNMARFGIRSEMSHRFSVLFNYTNFYLDYDDGENAWLDRIDNRFSLSVAYEHSPKTNIFLEYDRSYITYDSDIFNDSDEDVMYLGVNWKGSAKSSLMAKGGYQRRQYDPSLRDDAGAFTAELQFFYHITEKTSISLYLYKALEETDSLNNQGKDTIAGRLHYQQKFSHKLLGTLNFWYEKNSYDEFTRIDLHDRISGREDKRFAVRPSLRYVFRDWLMGEIAYTFESRNSTDNNYDFTTQALLISLNIAF